MKKFANYFFVAIALVLPQLSAAQDLNLVGSSKSLQSSIEQLYPIVAGIGLLFVAFRNLHNFKEGGDFSEGIKAIFWYILIALAIMGAYKFIVAQAL